MYNLFLKRLFDCVIALVVLLGIGWFLIIIACWLHFANKGTGVFFFQDRPGKNEKIFKLIKFKTMTDECDKEGRLMPDAVRLTKIGKFLRSTSIDELPQLINVIKGDMSLVGPRPLLPRYLTLYNDRQARRHIVKPGITGWSQVNGRNAISWEQKLELDVWYVDNISFLLDIKILFLTSLKVFLREGINGTNSVSGVSFTGNNKYENE